MFIKCEAAVIFKLSRSQTLLNMNCLELYLHSSWGCCFSYFSLIWETPKSGCNQWSASECRWVRRRPRDDTQRNLWISAIFWITPCENTRKENSKKITLIMTIYYTKNASMSYPDICAFPMPDITGPVTGFTVCLKIMEDFQNSIHGARGPFKASGRATGTNTSAAGHPRTGFNPTTTGWWVIVVGFQVRRRCHVQLRWSPWG